MSSGAITGRVAVVTGGASGIGLGIGRRFAGDGHRVALLDRDGAALEPAVAESTASGTKVLGLTADVSDRAAVDAALAKVRTDLGPVEILVTSAGIESFQPLLEITAESWARIIAVNLTGTFNCVQAAVSDMVAGGWGRIVTISSQSAQSGAPNMVHYSASKGGVISLTRALAVELARSGITANTIAPSLVDTPHGPACHEHRRFPWHRCDRAHDPARPCRHARRYRRRLQLLLGGGQLHDGPDPRCQRRDVHLKGATSRGCKLERRCLDEEPGFYCKEKWMLVVRLAVREGGFHDQSA